MRNARVFVLRRRGVAAAQIPARWIQRVHDPGVVNAPDRTTRAADGPDQLRLDAFVIAGLLPRTIFPAIPLRPADGAGGRSPAAWGFGAALILSTRS
jgi:hypothetical protein